MSSDHRVGGLPLLRLSARGRHFRSRMVQRLSVNLAAWPAHLHFTLDIRVITSQTPVLCLMSSFLTLSRKEMPSIARSIDLCVTCSLAAEAFVSVNVYDPYVITGITHCSNTFLFKHIGRLLFRIFLSFPKAAHSRPIRRCISHVWLSRPMRIWWPRYM